MKDFSAAQAATIPHSVEAEQQVLGAILLDPDRIPVALASGGASLFYDPVHAAIFKVAADKLNASEVVSPVTVANAPSLQEALADLGGKAYIVRLAGAAISSSMIGGYVDFLAETRTKRQGLEIVTDAAVKLSQEDTSATEILAGVEGAISALETTAKARRPVSMMKAVTGALDASFSAYRGEERRVVGTGIGALDRLVGGFGPGELILLGGRPSMGKSAVALSCALAAARAGHPVVIASLEMTPESMAMRALSEATSRQRASTSYADMSRGLMSEEQARSLAEAAKEVAELPMQFLPPDFRDVDALTGGTKQALRLLPKGKLPLIVVDYLQLLRSSARDRFQQITEISIALKSLSMKSEAPVVALSQLSRALEGREDKRPMLSDLRESGQLEQDADSVIFCYRDEYYLERQKPDDNDLERVADWHEIMARAKNRLELIVAKQRKGPIGTAHVRFNPAINAIWEDNTKPWESRA